VRRVLACKQGRTICTTARHAAKPQLRMEKSETEHNELFKANHGETLGTRTSSATGCSDPVMATVGKLHRAEDSQG
jgi:hypothetical protein